MDEDLKKEFEVLCSSFGMSMTTAINVFAKAVVRERRIPFQITSEPINTSDALENFMKMREIVSSRFDKELTPDEVNELIKSVRKSN